MSVEARPAAPAPDVVPPVPRALSFVTVKRNVALAGRSYGHWWVELDGAESYGWWPARAPLTTRDMLLGGPGVLNAMGTPADGSPVAGTGRPTCPPRATGWPPWLGQGRDLH